MGLSDIYALTSMAVNYSSMPYLENVFNHTAFLIRAWINIYISLILTDVISYLYHPR